MNTFATVYSFAIGFKPVKQTDHAAYSSMVTKQPNLAGDSKIIDKL